LNVIELEHLAGLALVSVLGDERAPAAVTRHHGAPNLSGNGSTPAHHANPLDAGLVGRRALALLQLSNELIQRTIEDLGHVSRRKLMAEQVLRVVQLLVGFPSQADLQRESLRREGHRGRRSGGFNTFRRVLGGELGCRSFAGPFAGSEELLRHLGVDRYGEKILLGESLRQELGDFGLALVRRRVHQILGVLLRGVRRQHADRAHVQSAFCQRDEHGRELPRHTTHPNAVEGRLLAELELLHAIAVNGIVAGLPIDPSRIDLGYVDD
jgi:hypothetical protein